MLTALELLILSPLLVVILLIFTLTKTTSMTAHIPYIGLKEEKNYFGMVEEVSFHTWEE
jgi:hypothetical protein